MIILTKLSQACRQAPALARSLVSSAHASRTALYELHLRHDGKMVQFANHWLPLVYKSQGLLDSHMHVRHSAGLFDVSHMLQTYVRGEHAAAFLESLCVADAQALLPGNGTLSVITTAHGGIVDDLIVSRVDEDTFYVVSNAGCAEKVRALFERRSLEFQGSGRPVSVSFMNDRLSLVALQGPRAAETLQKLLARPLNDLYFMQSRVEQFDGTDMRITRCGYTGEDGFELSVANEKVNDLVEALLQSPDVQLAGLGARDSLRLEAGLCLYGNDIDENTSPIEAGLTWTIGKRRREVANATFPGSSVILAQLSKQREVTRKRVGLKALNSGAPARQGATIVNKTGEQIGQITSGCPSPILKENIAIGYVPNDLSKIGTRVQVQVRSKQYEYEVVKMPFVPTNYYVPSKK